MKKKIIIITISVILLLIAISTTIFIVTNKNNNITTVGFYEIPDKISQVYKEIITKDNKNKIEFKNLQQKDLNTNKITKKVDVLITYNGALTQKLMSKGKTISQDIMDRFPRTIRKSPMYNFIDDNKKEPRIFPISLDFFETLVLTTAVDYYNLPLAEKTTELKDFGKKANEIYPFPIIISGNDDLTINSFFTQLIEAFGGKSGYENIKTQMENDESLNNFYNYIITEKSGTKITVSTILDLIKDWENEGIISRKWQTTSKERTAQLIEDNRVAMALMTLSEHRNVKSSNINYYETIVFPPMPETSDGERLSIQPVIVGMVFKNSAETKIITSRLTSIENQELISLQTQLGLSTLQGTSFDRQADDARFFAASFPGGPVPDLATLVFEDSEKRHKMAELIRNYK